jgi:beta-aspartyl-peptidase (threonine type)
MPIPVLALHGGAGTISPEDLRGREQGYQDGLRRALRAGWQVLAGGGPALDAVQAAVMALEDDAHFNAGHGATFTTAGTTEMEACIMDGPTRRTGAAALLCGPRNPVQVARLVMEQTPHTLVVGETATRLAREAGLAFEDAAYFRTERRWEALQVFLARNGDVQDDALRHGTVGAVACDAAGRLAAATSTGGRTGKMPSRIGDTPLAGAGTWADERVAFSGTGLGEAFVRSAAGAQLSARMRWAGESLDTAAQAVLDDIASLGGDGGLVAVDRDGHVTLPFNSRGMYRGAIGADGVPRVAIHGEPLAA